MMGRVVVAGGTGFIGRALCARMAEAGYEVVALSRSPGRAGQVLGDRARIAEWDARNPTGWVQWVDGARAVVNLTGENIGSGRWNEEHKRRILESRVDAARAVVRAIERAHQKPSVLVQGSAVGYYGHRGDEPLNESSTPGAGFLAGVVRTVEEAAGSVRLLGVRLVLARTGVVLGRGGGMLARIMPLFRFFVGGPVGSGKQWVPWVHLGDEVGAIRFLVERGDLDGPFNLCAPDAVRMNEFCRAIGRGIGRPSWLPVPAFALRLIFGDMADEVMLASTRVLPERLVEAGYEFRFPDLGIALDDVLARGG